MKTVTMISRTSLREPELLPSVVEHRDPTRAGPRVQRPAHLLQLSRHLHYSPSSPPLLPLPRHIAIHLLRRVAPMLSHVLRLIMRTVVLHNSVKVP